MYTLIKKHKGAYSAMTRRKFFLSSASTSSLCLFLSLFPMCWLCQWTCCSFFSCPHKPGPICSGMSSTQTKNQEARASVLRHAGMEKHCRWNFSDPWARLSFQQPKQSLNCSHLRSCSKFQAISWFLENRMILNPYMPQVSNIQHVCF